MLPTSLGFVTSAHLGQLLKSARKGKKLTQRDVASRLGLSQSRVSYLELNPDDISVHQLLSWCSVLDLEMSVGERQMYVPSSDVEW